ncbi:ABC transporter permease [Gordonia sp. DT30]|uniref:ABC transporter permease n=1 Tax=Gordonia sp. DT30 TaxID=3416546 RepID=UPI003CEA13F0
MILVVGWQAVGTATNNRTISTPWAIAQKMLKDGWQFYAPNLAQTAYEATVGLAIGVAIAVGLAVLILVVPLVEGPVLQLALTFSSLPLVALGPILAIMFDWPTPQIILAALGVFFTTLVGALAGLRAADPISLDLVDAAGGSRLQSLRKVRLPAALPALFTALRIAPSGAVLGAIIGEYLGGKKGVGVAFITAGQALEIERTWGLALAASAIAGVGFLGVVALEKLILTWEPDKPVDLNSVSRPRREGPWPLRLLSALGQGVITLAIVLMVWDGMLRIFHVNSFFGKTPTDVAQYLFGTDSSAHLAEIGGEAARTFTDAGIGVLAGLVFGLVGAAAFQRSALVQVVFTPFALVMRSVPLVALTPLIVAIMGRGMVAVAVIGAVVTFFPTLVIMSQALASTPQTSLDLVVAFGGSPAAAFWKVRVPNGLPALFTSLRVSAPLAIIGALVAEWLATGKGLGYTILTSTSVADFTGLWSRVVVITLGAVVIYKIADLAEHFTRTRFSGGY